MRSKAIRIFAAAMLTIGLLLPSAAAPVRAVAGNDPAVLFTHDFENGSLDGWVPRGSGVKLTPAYSGSYSLKTSHRTANWQGPSLDVKSLFKKGALYEVSAYVKLAQTPATASTIKITVENTPAGGKTGWTTVAQQPVAGTDWTQLKGQYSYTQDMDNLTLYVESSDPNEDFYIDHVIVSVLSSSPAEKTIQQDIPSVYKAYAGDFSIGAAVEPNQLEGEHAALLKKHFNSIVAENAMKPASIQPTEGYFNWGSADQIAEFAKANHMSMRGHTLVWHNQVPDWFFLDKNGKPMTPTKENKQLLLKRLEDHIRAVVGRYKDVVDSWDVVNEVIDASQPDGMRHSKWYEIAGTDYIDKAFESAHQAAPDAKLFINDYNTVSDPKKRRLLYDFVRKELAKGVPISGVGHQMHINIASPSGQALKDTIRLFAGLGLDNQITEMDMSVYTNSTDKYQKVPENVLVQQGYRYKEIFDALKSVKNDVSRVMFWGIADDHTWLKNRSTPRLDEPLLFDENLQAKYAYWGIVDPSKLPARIQNVDAGKGTPRIDGTADFFYDGTQTVSMRAAQGEFSVNVRTLWDDQYLYVLANVKDPSRDSGDRLDVFIDGNNDKTKSYESDDAHYRFNMEGKPPHGPKYKIRKTAGGSRLETAIPWQAKPAAGKQIGFDVRATDGKSGQVISWNDTTGSQDADTSKFGTFTLQGQVLLDKVTMGTPVIDGKEDAAWSQADQFSTHRWVQGTSGATGSVKLLWDSGHLYVFAKIRDAQLSKASKNPWEQDSVEFFVDQNHHQTGYYEADDGQYRVNFENKQSYGGSAAADKFQTAVKRVAGGYEVEAAIRLDAVDPMPGSLIGFDFQINDDQNGDGKRDSVAIWSDPSGLSYMNTSKYGTLKLISGWPKKSMEK